MAGAVLVRGVSGRAVGIDRLAARFHCGGILARRGSFKRFAWGLGWTWRVVGEATLTLLVGAAGYRQIDSPSPVFKGEGLGAPST